MAYAIDLAADHCQETRQEQLQQVADGQDSAPAGEGHECDCVCHMVVSTVAVERVIGPVVGVVERLVIRDEFPPDSVPAGIDYPPQLA